ncbi:MAG: phosphoribosyl isomerase A [Acidobacteriota bacterium]
MSARFEVIPSIDLRRGRVVRLREGRDDQATVYATPAELLLERFAAAGARRVHVVDLDAAFGEPPQRERLAALLRAAERQDQAVRSPIRLQLGGGLRDAAAVESALDAGFDRVVLGSMIVRDPETFEQLCRRHAGRIVPALDCRADEVLHDGWKSRSSLLWKSLALSFNQKSLVFPSILVTDVARDGTLAGANVELAAAVGETAGAPAIVSGGVASIEDVARAAAAAHAGRGIGGIVLGRALHEGRLTIEAALAAASFELAGSVAR